MQNANKPENTAENFLQVWGKELNQEDEKGENLELDGPVGHVISDFQNVNDNSFEAHSNIYNPIEDSLEDFFDETPKDFEQILDE